MKIVFSMAFIAGVLMLSLNGHAQVKKGEMMLGGDLGINTRIQHYQTEPTVKWQEFWINPQFGVGVGKNWIIGVWGGFGYDQTKQNPPDPTTLNDYSYYAGVFARKFYTFTEKFGIYAQANFDAGFGKTEGINLLGKTITKYRHLNSYCRPGLYFKAGRKFIFEGTFAQLSFLHQIKRTQFKDETNEFTFSVQDGLGVGFVVIL